MCTFCFDVLYAQLHNMDPPPDPYSGHPTANGHANGGIHHNFRSNHHGFSQQHHPHQSVSSTANGAFSYNYFSFNYFSFNSNCFLLFFAVVFIELLVPERSLPIVRDVENRPRQEAPRLHRNFLRYESSCRTQGIRPYQVTP